MPRKPRLFIGSSREALDVARAVQSDLDYEVEATIWNQNIFEPSGLAIDSLIRAIQSVDFAVMVLAPDDSVTIRGHERRAVRDNVIFELGMAVGRLGRQRSFMLLPRNAPDIQIPSDLLGVTPVTYDPDRSDDNLLAAVGQACSRMRESIRALGLLQNAPEVRIADPRAVSMGMRQPVVAIY